MVIVRNNSVLECNRAGMPSASDTAAVGNAAPAATAVGKGLIPTDCAVAEHHCPALVVDAAAGAIASTVRAIAVEGTIVNG